MKKLAIVGIGPRGLSALENLFLEAFNQKLKTKFHVTLFETYNQLGAGRIWDTTQTEVNWLNISERGLKDLKGRKEVKINNIIIPSFPSYTEWLPSNEKYLKTTDPDIFPPRKKLGKYLEERCSSIVEVLKNNNIITVVSTTITNIETENNKLILSNLDNQYYTFDEVLITIGHQPTKFEKDVEEYKIESFNKNFLCFTEPYPLTRITGSTINKEKNVAIRGFGLAMIDVVRALTIEKGGSFEIQNKDTFESTFKNSALVPNQILPYSLDGLPMAPKPINAIIDSQFEISSKQADYFESEISKVAKGVKKVKDNSFLKHLIAELSFEIFVKLEYKFSSKEITEYQLKNIIKKWLSNSKYKNDLILDTDFELDYIINAFVQMACGKKAISLDYCIGQVWRHCQPILYKAFSHPNVSEDIIAGVIELDEQLKRYSYGPPVESMQQLLALSRAKILNLKFCNNPKITIEQNTLTFEKYNDKKEIHVIINSVLNPPKLLEVTSPIILNLLRNDLIEPIHSKLGIHTKENGLIMNSDLKKEIPLAVLGRLSKGSVIGVDAILECFGVRIENWAKDVVKRLN